MKRPPGGHGDADAADLGHEQGTRLAWCSAATNALAPLFGTIAMERFSPLAAAALTATVGAVAALMVLLVRRRRVEVQNLRQLLPWSVLHGIGYLLMFVCLFLVGPVTQSILGRLYVVQAAIVGNLVLRERLGLRNAVLVGVALVGGLLWGSGGELASSLLGFAAGVGFTGCFALANGKITQHARAANIGSDVIVGLNFSVAAVLLGILILLPIEHPGQPVTGGSAAAIGGVFAGAIASVASLLMMYESFKRMSFAQSNIIRSASAVLGALVAWPFYARPLTAVSAAGAILLLAAAMLVSRKKPDSQTPSAFPRTDLT